jgi:uncharacterized Ntn-hydrolase superfamily protein
MTYSIVARDKSTGLLGVAVQSHYFSVGSVVTWARAGVGAVATQSFAEPSYGALGLELMSSGKSAADALNSLLSIDPMRELRQVAMVDSRGNVAVHTGKECIPWAGHATGEGFSVQANLMSNDTIWGAMKDAYQANLSPPFAERLAQTLLAAERAGGDIRGSQSAAILIVEPTVYPNAWMGRVLELRVEDHPNPVEELIRLIKLKRAYEWADKGEQLLLEGKYDESLKAYEESVKFAELDELKYWRAISLLRVKRKDEAQKILDELYAKSQNWKTLTQLMVWSGRLKLDD